MPQASDELRAMFLGGEAEALHYLETFGIRDWCGVFWVPNSDAFPPRVWAALQYLRDEWDYAIELQEVSE